MTMGKKQPGPEIGREESLERAGRFYERVVEAAAAATKKGHRGKGIIFMGQDVCCSEGLVFAQRQR